MSAAALARARISSIVDKLLELIKTNFKFLEEKKRYGAYMNPNPVLHSEIANNRLDFSASKLSYMGRSS